MRIGRLRRSSARVARGPTAAEHPSFELMAAAAKGVTVEVQRCLDAGGDPNHRDKRGNTALHVAVAAEHLDTAACLLANGANHALVNAKGKTPLEPDFCRVETLHGIRQRYHRRSYSRPLAAPASPDAARWASDLERDGIVRVSGLITQEVLTEMRAEFEDFAAALSEKVARGEGNFKHYDEEEHLWVEDRTYLSNNAFKYSRALTVFACDQRLVETARTYVGAEPVIQRALAMRYLPCTVPDKDMFGWHHDMEEKRCKVMVLLTDVGEEDQCMSYVLGSHKLFHPYAMFRSNPCPLDYCRERMPEVQIFNAFGAAGDIFLFDTNGAHRGNRRELAATRDVFLVEYNASKHHVWGGDIDTSVFANLPAGASKPFEQMLAVPRKWTLPLTRREPTWIGQLPQIDSWL